MLKVKIMNSFISDTIEYMEIGASGGLRDFGWLTSNISYLGFEANERLAQQKLNLIKKNYDVKSVDVFPYALSPVNNEKLYLTENTGCSSLLEPNIELLKKFEGVRKNAKSVPWSNQFNVIDQLDISAVNPAELELFKTKRIDAIQIDIQGLEYEVLSSLPNLKDVLFIDVEISLQQLYKDQKVFDQINILMEKNDMELVSIDNRVFASRYNLTKNKYNYVPECRGDIIQFDAVYVKKSSVLINKKDPTALMKVACLVEMVGNLPLAAFYARESFKIKNETSVEQYINYLEQKVSNLNRQIKRMRPYIRVFNFFLRVLGSHYRADIITPRDNVR